MITIWKFPLKIQDEQRVTMPRGSRLLDVQFQHGQLCLWALVYKSASPVSRIIWIHGTGHDIGFDPDTPHVATVQMMVGQLVWHVFDGGEQ